TIAKYMICPKSLDCGSSIESMSEQGLSDFEEYDYRMGSVSYQPGNSGDVDALLNAIKRSLQKIDSSKHPLLLLSDGKDSMALAVGYSRLGESVETLTFLRREDHGMKEYITKVCRKLGHRPYFVEVDHILNQFSKETFVGACGVMESPVLDQGFMFFLYGLKSFFGEGTRNADEYVVIDGLGNDETFGYLPSSNQYRSFLLSKLGLWKLIPTNLRALKWYIRSPCESHGDLSTLGCIFPIPKSFDLNQYFSKVKKSSEPVSFVDFRAFSRGAFHDHQCMMGKTKAATTYLGADVVFPWIDTELANFVFNLQIEDKFDFSSLTNKLLLRKLLLAEIGWEQSKRGVDLYYDLEEKWFKSEVLASIVPFELISIIDSNLILPNYAKKRAYLELLNLYGFCLNQKMTHDEIKELLLG
ncbi:MAG: hypothetical protein ABJ186_13035, partial [Marinobacter sp.]